MFGTSDAIKGYCDCLMYTITPIDSRSLQSLFQGGDASDDENSASEEERKMYTARDEYLESLKV